MLTLCQEIDVGARPHLEFPIPTVGLAPAPFVTPIGMAILQGKEVSAGARRVLSLIVRCTMLEVSVSLRLKGGGLYVGLKKVSQLSQPAQWPEGLGQSRSGAKHHE